MAEGKERKIKLKHSNEIERRKRFLWVITSKLRKEAEVAAGK